MTSLDKQSGGSKANDHGTDHVVYGIGGKGSLGQQNAHGEKNVQNVEHFLRSLIVGQSTLKHANAEQIGRTQTAEQNIRDVGANVKIFDDGCRTKGQIDAKGSQQEEGGKDKGRDGVEGEDGGAAKGGGSIRRHLSASGRGHANLERQTIVVRVFVLPATSVATTNWLVLVRSACRLPHGAVDGGVGDVRRRAVLEGRGGAGCGDEEDNAAEEILHGLIYLGLLVDECI